MGIPYPCTLLKFFDRRRAFHHWNVDNQEIYTVFQKFNFQLEPPMYIKVKPGVVWEVLGGKVWKEVGRRGFETKWKGKNQSR
jgi:hypothetical protein